MSTNKIRRLPVLEKDKQVGILVTSDFIRYAGRKTILEEIIEAYGATLTFLKTTDKIYFVSPCFLDNQINRYHH